MIAHIDLNNLGNFDNMLFVLDGDEYSAEHQKREKIGRVLTGTAEGDNVRRQLAYEKITQLNSCWPKSRRIFSYFNM
ncbi:hypothetical protein [Flavobacterium sp. XS2P39]|uniref:hypothetical protein n=1 Tax=Flavobacterium sp. XS2P39 TaxID=3401725 RepID=UPI003AAA443A